MVHRTMGFPHKAKPKSAYRVIWDNPGFQPLYALRALSC